MLFRSEFTTTTGEALKITGTQQRTTTKEGIDVVCGMYYLCEIDGKECKLTSDKLSQRIGESVAKSSKDFTPSNLEAVKKGYENYIAELYSANNAYIAKINAIQARYKMDDVVTDAQSTTTLSVASESDFIDTWSEIIANNNARREQEKQAKAQATKAAKALDVLKGLSPEMLAALLSQLQSTTTEEESEEVEEEESEE